MKTFKQFMSETPIEMDDYPKDYLKPEKFRAGKRGAIVDSKISESPTHKYYMSHEPTSHMFHTIRVTDKKGNAQFTITGTGYKNHKTFQAHNVTGHEGRTMKYHEAISHLVKGGHIKRWHSDHTHTKGSKEAYDDLTHDPDLHVNYVPLHGNKERVRPGEIEDFYGFSGSFEVKKARK